MRYRSPITHSQINEIYEKREKVVPISGCGRSQKQHHVIRNPPDLSGKFGKWFSIGFGWQGNGNGHFISVSCVLCVEP